jgi:hypothetical protein
MIMAEQNHIDPADVSGRDRRARKLARASAPPEAVGLAGQVEGQVGQHPPSAGLDENRRPADVRQAHGRLGLR